MKILLTNDDGISAAGIDVLQSLCKEVFPKSEITIVAPKFDKSGVGTSMTLRKSIEICQFDKNRYSVDGTPVDCVIIALQKILTNKPDLVISGINHGANVGFDSVYSGTIGAAVEAMINGIKAIAISQFYELFDNVEFFAHNKFLTNFLYDFAHQPEYKGVISVNLPNKSPIGIKFVKQGEYKTWNDVTEMEEGKVMICSNIRRGVGKHFVEQGFITVTPLNYDLTDYQAMVEE